MRFWLLALPRLLISRFSVVRTPSVETTQGDFLSPKHSHDKFFRKFFQNYPRRLFADFLARIYDEGECLLLLAVGGGTLFLWACGLVVAPLLCLPFLSFRFPFPRSSLAPALSLVAFPLSLWASVPYWLTASGHTGSA